MPRPSAEREAITVRPDVDRATVPAAHPLEMWDIEQAAQRTRLSVETLRTSSCPRCTVGRRVLFDPVETIAWVRLHLSHVVSPSGRAA